MASELSKPSSIDEINASIFQSVLGTTHAATQLSAQDLEYFQTIDPSNINAIQQCSQKLLDLTSSLLDAARPEQINLRVEKPSDLVGEWRQIAEINDYLFEKVDTFLDIFSGRKTEVEKSKDGIDGTSTKRKREKLESNLYRADIEKPQLKFKTVPNNFDRTPFKPLLTSKPNSMIPLEQSLQLVYKDDGEMPSYQNPYTYEIENAPYPPSVMRLGEVIEPPPLESSTAKWIETKEDFSSMLSDLRDSSEIAVDLEHHDHRSYIGFVCLMQISTRTQDYVVDTLQLRDELQALNEVFTNPNIIKVFHGSTFDIIWLQRDFGLYIVGLFDTYHAARVLNFEGKSLSYLLDILCSFKASKKYQLADWRIRPLSEDMLMYARCDTHFLLSIFDKLRNKLVSEGGDKLNQVLKSSRNEARQRYEKTSVRGEQRWQKLADKFSIVDPKQVEALRKLCDWRENLAMTEDEGVGYIISNRLLVSLAKNQPITISALLAVTGKHITKSVRSHAEELISLFKGNDMPADKRTSHDINEESMKPHGEDLQNDIKDQSEMLQKRLKLIQDLYLSKKSAKSIFQLSKNSEFWGDCIS
ncbi:ribonuclease H-like domain-containing protein [Dipodascopsis uninucleata]